MLPASSAGRLGWEADSRNAGEVVKLAPVLWTLTATHVNSIRRAGKCIVQFTRSLNGFTLVRTLKLYVIWPIAGSRRGTAAAVFALHRLSCTAMPGHAFQANETSQSRAKLVTSTRISVYSIYFYSF